MFFNKHIPTPIGFISLVSVLGAIILILFVGSGSRSLFGSFFSARDIQLKSKSLHDKSVDQLSIPASITEKKDRLYLAVAYRYAHNSQNKLINDAKPVNIFLTVPQGSRIKYLANEKGELQSELEFGGNTYKISAGESGGPNYDCDCTFEYLTEPEGSRVPLEAIKIWKDKEGIEAINPWGLKIKDYYISSVMIIKKSPSTAITDKELGEWRSMLQSASIEVSN